MNFTLVSFGTPTPKTYRKGLYFIRKSCKNLGIPHYLWRTDPVTFHLPGWNARVLYKATFIKNMLNGFNDTIVWLDADCRILGKFDLPKGDWDIGVIPHTIPRNRIHHTPWLVSLLAFRSTSRAKRFLTIWEYLSQWKDLQHETGHEQFGWALALMEKEIRVQNILPCVRGKVHLDPRHRKRTKLTYDEVSAELDTWYPEEVKLPKDKHKAIIEYVRRMTC